MHTITFYGQLDHIKPIQLAGVNLEVVISGLKQYVPNIRYLLNKYQCNAHLNTKSFTPDCEIAIVPSATGASLTLAGFTQFMAVLGAVVGGVSVIQQRRVKKHNKKARGDDEPGYLFNGVVNSQIQGDPHPILYGRFFCSSVVINNELTGERRG